MGPPKAQPPPEAPKDEYPKLTVGFGLRTGLNLSFQDPSTGDKQAVLKLDDGLVDQVNIRPYMTAEFTKNISAVANFELGTARGLGFSILDAIVQLKAINELQLWVGQHIPANDRNNMNGPFYANGWNFPITVQSYPFDVGARDRGATLWGLIAGGKVKYHASVVDLQPERTVKSARYAGRITVHLLEPEDFYYNSGTYWGKKDVLAIGAVAQYQKSSPVTPTTENPTPNADNDFKAFSFDAFFEKNLGTAGTITLEGGYWNFSGVGPGYVVNQGTRDAGLGVAGPLPGSSWLASAAWLTPEKVGPGQIQPNVRVQGNDIETAGGGSAKTTTIDVGVTYVVDGFNHKYHLNYRHEDAAVDKDMIQVGAQFQVFK